MAQGAPALDRRSNRSGAKSERAIAATVAEARTGVERAIHAPRLTGRTAAALAMLRDSASPAANAHPARLAQWLPTLDAFAEPSPMRISKAKEANLAAARLNPGQATYAAMALSQLGEIEAAFAVIDGLLLSKGLWSPTGGSFRAASWQIPPAGAAPNGYSCLHLRRSVATLTSRRCARRSDWRAIGGSAASLRIRKSRANSTCRKMGASDHAESGGSFRGGLCLLSTQSCH